MAKMRAKIAIFFHAFPGEVAKKTSKKRRFFDSKKMSDFLPERMKNLKSSISARKKKLHTDAEKVPKRAFCQLHFFRFFPLFWTNLKSSISVSKKAQNLSKIFEIIVLRIANDQI